MDFIQPIQNKPIPIRLQKKIDSILEPDTPVLMTIVGDLQLNAQYGDSVLLVTNGHLLCAEEDSSDGFFMPICEINEAKVIRQYSNAVLRINGKNAFRFSFKIVALVEAAAAYLESVAKGDDQQKALLDVALVLEKERSFCPKCGRALIRPGAACISCMNKGNLLKRLWAYIAPQKWALLLCLLLSALTSAMTLIPPYITKMLVDDVLPNKNLSFLYQLVFFLLGVYIIQNSVGALRAHFLRITGDKIVTSLRNDVYEKAQYLPVSFHDKTSTGSMFSRISGDTGVLNTFMMRISQEAVVQFFLMIGIMVIMFFLNWKLALLSLIPVPIVVLGSRIFSRKILPVYRRIWTRWSAVSSVLSDTLPGIRVIKSFTGEKRATQNFKTCNDAWYKEDKKASGIVSVFPQVVTFLITCGSLIIWGLGGNWTILGGAGMTTGLLVSFISYASMFYAPVNFFANLSDSYQQMLTSTERLLDILDAEPEKDFGNGKGIKPLDGRIEFRDITFSFDKTTKTLDQVNLTIEPGQIVGIVGTTGSGKSTLINLLMRFYDNYDGDILVDGQNIQDIDLEYYRSQIGYVQQEPLMFRDTIFKNIAFSKPDAPVESVIGAADVANAHEFITKLPDGYDTILGERGCGLSGGERQRLSIARAVIKNPAVLIFDEATAAVDSETEHLIQEAIERLIKGRTTLMIAHRLSTLRKADKIVVVDKGKIIEYGSHDELMKLKGKYFRLIEIQNMSEEIQRKTKEEEFEE